MTDSKPIDFTWRPASVAALRIRSSASLGVIPLLLCTFFHLEQKVSMSLDIDKLVCFVPLVLWLVVKLLLKPFLASDTFQALALGCHNVFLVL